MDKRYVATLTLCCALAACGGAGTDDGAMAAGESAVASPVEGDGSAAEFLGEPASHWVDQLRDGADTGERTRAIAALASLGPAQDGVTESLIAALADPEMIVKTGANQTLTRFGVAVAPEMIVALRGDPDAGVRAGVAPVLGNWSDDADVNAALCAALLNDTDVTVRTAAARGLTVGGEKSAAAVPSLIEALEDASAEVRQFAALALGRIGSAATDAIEALERAEQDPAPMVANAARTALRQIRR